jgi:hypothetical protein
MRDFYDVHILWKLRENVIDKRILTNALINTSRYRKTYDQSFSEYISIIKSIEHDQSMMKMWEIYQSSYPFAKDISWEEAIDSLKSIIEIVTNQV